MTASGVPTVVPRDPAAAEPSRWVLVACILASSVVFVDATVVNVGLAAIGRDLHASLAGEQWVMAAYLLALGSLVLSGGALGDVLGRRRVFALGVGGFGVASLACALAPSIDLLIAARALQGMSAALMVPGSMAIIVAAFPIERRGAAIGAWIAWTSASTALGPPLGGVLIDVGSWRLIFALNLPLVAATLALIVFAVPSFPRRAQALDLPGALLCALGLGGPVYALIEQPDHGWTDARVLGSMSAGLLLVAFVVRERRTAEPMLPLVLFRARNFAVGNLATLAIWGGTGAATFLVLLYLQQVAGYSAVSAGAALLPVTLMIMLLSQRFAALAARRGAHLLMGLGPLVAGAGLLLFLRIGPRADYWIDIMPAAAVYGLGMTITAAPLTATVLAAVGSGHAGVASGVNNALARVGGVLAIALVGVVVSARFGAVLDQQAATPRANAGQVAAVTRLARRPLRVSTAAPELRPAATAASVSAFRAGMGVCALLVITGGLVSLIGIRDGRGIRRLEPAAPDRPWALAPEPPSG